jgi:hypothetical protein
MGLGFDPSAENKILNVLDDPEFDWTTFNGILKATDIDPELVRDILKALVQQGRVVSTIEPKTSEVVFTTKQQYRRRHNFFDDSLTAGTGYVSY